MKLSKVVKDYIAAKVAAKYADHDKDAKESYMRDHDAVEIWCKDQIKQMNEQFRQRFAGLYDNNQAPFSYSASQYHMNSHKEMERKRVEKSMLIERKTNDILVSMELGGTKEDLDRMLAEL